MNEMADSKKYYYLKIKENFFDTEDMKLLESMENGYLYSNILMKMYLLSLKNNGKLIYKDTIPYNAKMLSTILNHNIDILEKAIKMFKELNLIDVMDSGAIFMLDIQNYIGKSSDEADRKRAFRNQIESEKTNVRQMSGQIDDILEIELNIESELKSELEIQKEVCLRHNSQIYIDIIDYLNNKTNSNYKHDGKKTKELIKARLNEGFVLEDFKRVIDNKVNSWGSDEKMVTYLRPETLFSNKFEGYLNEKVALKKLDAIERAYLKMKESGEI